SVAARPESTAGDGETRQAIGTVHEPADRGGIRVLHLDVVDDAVAARPRDLDRPPGAAAIGDVVARHAADRAETAVRDEHVAGRGHLVGAADERRVELL